MHATGYLETRSRHPVALVAAITLNLAAVGVMLAYNPKIIGIEPDRTKWIDIKPIVPIKPVEPIKHQQTKPSDNQPQPTTQPTATKPIIDAFPIENPIAWPDNQPLQPTMGPVDEPVTKPMPEPVVISPTVDPRYRDALQPMYPANLERQEIEGKVTVRVQVGIDGRITAVELVRADNPGFFAATRDQALRRWRFRPATRDGQPIVSWVEKTIVFKMPGN